MSLEARFVRQSHAEDRVRGTAFPERATRLERAAPWLLPFAFLLTLSLWPRGLSVLFAVVTCSLIASTSKRAARAMRQSRRQRCRGRSTDPFP